MTQVEYIESTGSQYIDTGFQDDSGSRVELEFEVVQLLSADFKNNYVYGNATSYASAQNSAYVTLANGDDRNNIGVMNNKIQYTYEEVILNKRYTVIANFTPNAQSAVINGDTVSVTPSSYTLGACSMGLFCAKSVNSYNGYYHGKCAIKLYYCRIYDHENNLVRDYIPVMDDNNVPCLWDNVSSAYKYNDGTGSFTAGDPIVPGYTVQFNANGGSGTMSDQSITEGVATPLTANTFTKDGCRFEGWALTSDGAVTYTDAQIVTDIAEAGDTLVLYAVWTVIAYSIDFNANGGTGSMSTQYINVGTATALSVNIFTREGYTFSGWALSASGSVVYTDGETVEDLGEAGDVIELYAVWAKTPIQGTLYTNNSPKNMLSKDLTSLTTVNIIFKDATNIIDPVFMFSGVDTDIIAACNYIYVPDLGRYYFVNKIETLRAGVWLLYCHVDVLMSYADEIKTQYAIVKRQEQKFNKYINDGIFKVYQYSNIETFPFSSGFSNIEYVLMVAGN